MTQPTTQPNTATGLRCLNRLVRRFHPIARVHHSVYSYGWVFRPIEIGWFPEYARDCRERGLKKTGSLHRVVSYHNCTATGVY